MKHHYITSITTIVSESNLHITIELQSVQSRDVTTILTPLSDKKHFQKGEGARIKHCRGANTKHA